MYLYSRNWCAVTYLIFRNDGTVRTKEHLLDGAQCRGEYSYNAIFSSFLPYPINKRRNQKKQLSKNKNRLTMGSQKHVKGPDLKRFMVSNEQR